MMVQAAPGSAQTGKVLAEHGAGLGSNLRFLYRVGVLVCLWPSC